MYKIREHRYKDIKGLASLWVKNHYFKDTDFLRVIKHLSWKYNRKFTKVWIAEENKSILGTCGKIKYPLILGNKEIINGRWGLDSLIDKNIDYRKRSFIFFRVFRNVILEEHRKKERYLIFCFPNKIVRDTYLKIGWVDIPLFSEFVKEIVFKEKDKVVPPQYKQIELLKISEFDHSWDVIWKSLCSKYGLISLRESAYLNWRYFKCPDKNYSVFLAKTKRHIEGYLVLRQAVNKKHREGIIVDFLVNPKNKKLLKAMIIAAVLFFKNKGADRIRCYCSYEAFKQVLLSLGFKFKNKADFFVFGRNKELLDKVIKNKKKWFVTAGDGDFEMED